MPDRSITVIGAGIAGLTAALYLAKHGFGVDIVEQAGKLSDVGAGLQLSPNATRLLDRLGILASLEPLWNEPERVSLISGLTLEPLTHVPLGENARQRWKAPYAVLLRSTLQKALLDAVVEHPLCHLHFGQSVGPSGPVDLSSITGRRADLTIGADGVWSKQRSRIAGAAPARFAGRLAWRSLLPFASAPGFLHRDQVTAFLGPRSHLVVYPLKDAGAFNLVAITDGSERSRNFGMPLEPDDRARLEKAFLHWNPAIRSLVLDQANPLCWPLFEMADGPWHNGRDLVLVGDAAHAMTPFAAQGACMAIEDSYILAQLLSTRPQAEAIRDFETLRRPRIARVRRRAAFNRFAYHARGPVRVVRDMILTHRSPESLSQDFDWLYGYDPD